MRKFRLPAVLLAALCLTGCAAQEEVSPEELDTLGVMEGDLTEAETASAENRLPALHSFTAQTMDGQEITQEIFADKDVTVINIWQTTCPPCIAEMPEIAELTDELPENVQFMTWCLDAGYASQSAQQIVDTSGFSGITIESGDGDLMTMLTQIMYTPTTVFLDSQGNQIGEPIIGSAEDAKALYRDGINAALREIGKDELS